VPGTVTQTQGVLPTIHVSPIAFPLRGRNAALLKDPLSTPHFEALIVGHAHDARLTRLPFGELHKLCPRWRKFDQFGPRCPMRGNV
jgi:hypothetical protein